MYSNTKKVFSRIFLISLEISDTNRNKVVPAKVINVENLQTPFSG